jgi:hypothetical protein
MIVELFARTLMYFVFLTEQSNIKLATSELQTPHPKVSLRDKL